MMSPKIYLGRGHTWHQRLLPHPHHFHYGLYFLMLPMRAWQKNPALGNGLARNRWAAMSFHDRDHGLGGDSSLAWVEQLLVDAGLEHQGEIWLITLPRVLGFAFKPVSFWLFLDAAQNPRLVLAEVNNTFGERHVYWLDEQDGQTLAWKTPLTAKKVFHVSPFMPVTGDYQFTFALTAEHFQAEVDWQLDGQPWLRTGWRGTLTPYTPHTATQTFWRYPLMTWGVLWRIHLQAFKLWRKRLPFFSKPALPKELISR